MARIVKTFQITDDAGNQEFRVLITSTTTCMTITPTDTTTTNGIVTVTFEGDPVTCLDTADYTINAYAPDCNIPQTITGVLANPCTGFEITEISRDAFSFTVSPTGGTGTYTYAWNFPTTSWQAVGSTNSAILQLTPIGTPTSVTVYATVTDENGCTDTMAAQYNPLVPQIVRDTIAVYCNPDAPSAIGSCSNVNRTNTHQLTTVGGEFDIDWSTLQWTAPAGFCIEHEGNGFVRFNVDDTVLFGNYQVFFTVQDVQGIVTPSAAVAITAPAPCVESEELIDSIEVVDTITQATVDTIIGDVEVLYLPDRVKVPSGTTIDWTTVEVVGLLYAGTTTGYDSATKTFPYTYTKIGQTDDIAFRVQTTDGYWTEISHNYIGGNIPTRPVAVDNIYCVNCNTTNNLDVKVNDTGYFNFRDIIITEQPPVGTITVDKDNEVLVFTVPDNTIQIITFKYQYVSSDNTADVSNEATVTLEVECNGTPPVGATVC